MGPGGAAALSNDTPIDPALVGHRSSYFGGTGPDIPLTLRTAFDMALVHSDHGDRCRFPQNSSSQQSHGSKHS